MADTKQWCALIDNDKSLIGDVFDVETNTVSSLKRAVKEAHSIKLQNIDAPDLVVWWCKSLKLLSDAKAKDLKKSLATVDFSDEDSVFCVDGAQRLKDLKLFENELLLVEVPSTSEIRLLFLFLSPVFHSDFVIGIFPKPEIEFRYLEAAKQSPLIKIMPSSLNDLPVYEKLQNNRFQKILDDCPQLDLNIPALPLLYDGFGRFHDNFMRVKEGEDIDSKFKTLVDGLVYRTSEIEQESEKQWSLGSTLSEILLPSTRIPFEYTSEARSEFPNGYFIAVHGGPILLILIKREFTSAEPEMASYFHRLALKTREEIALAWRQPCLGVMIRG